MIDRLLRQDLVPDAEQFKGGRIAINGHHLVGINLCVSRMVHGQEFGFVKVDDFFNRFDGL